MKIIYAFSNISQSYDKYLRVLSGGFVRRGNHARCQGRVPEVPSPQEFTTSSWFPSRPDCVASRRHQLSKSRTVNSSIINNIVSLQQVVADNRDKNNDTISNKSIWMVAALFDEGNDFKTGVFPSGFPVSNCFV